MPTMSQFLTEDFPRPISINLNGTRHSFSNFSKYFEWCEKQKEFYINIGNINNITHIFQVRIINPSESLFNSNRSDEFTFKDLSDEFKSFIESAFQQYGLIDYASAEGKWLTKLISKNPSIAQNAAQYFITKKTNPSSLAQREGEFAAYLFEQGFKPDFDSEKAKYEDFYNEIIREKDELIEEIQKLKDEQITVINTSNEQNSNWSQTFTTHFDEIQKKFNDEFERHENKMKESEEFYEKKLAVKNAVVYWTEKAAEHKTNSWIFGVISGSLMIGMIITIICFGKYFVGLDLTKGTGAKLLTKSGALQLWVYGFFIISVTMVIWIIRLLVKVFLSNLHQLSDANERATMIQTYLAFEREEKTLTEKDKELVLPSIFRTSTHGIIKEDSAPNTPMNIFMGKS